MPEQEMKFCVSDSACDVVWSGLTKANMLAEVSRRYSLPLERMLFIGDSEMDIGAMKLCGYCACPSNATEDVKGYVNGRKGYVSRHSTAVGCIDIFYRHAGKLNLHSIISDVDGCIYARGKTTPKQAAAIARFAAGSRGEGTRQPPLTICTGRSYEQSVETILKPCGINADTIAEAQLKSWPLLMFEYGSMVYNIGSGTLENMLSNITPEYVTAISELKSGFVARLGELDRFFVKEKSRFPAKHNMFTIDITDSCCIDGLQEAISLGKKYGIKAIPGVEMQAESRVHILCYNFTETEQFGRLLKEARRWTDSGRLDKLLLNLKENYSIELSLEEMCAAAKSRSPSTKQVCEALALKGFASGWEEARDKYFSSSPQNGSCYAAPLFTPEEFVSAGKKAGGTIVLAHPFQIRQNEVNIDALMPRLVAAVLEGVEVHYNNQFMTPEKKSIALGIKEKYNLGIVSGGSDFEGEFVTCLGGSPLIEKAMVSNKLLGD